MFAPRNQTLSEAIYRDIDNNEYLIEIYEALLHNYSIKLLGLTEPLDEINIKDALRFADILSKSTFEDKQERHRSWGQEIAILLNEIYPDDDNIKYFLGSVLSSVGNFRGLQSETVGNFKSSDIFDGIYYEYNKSLMQIPGKDNEFFFPDQKQVYDGLQNKYFSYSGPTSMGKSFVVQTYVTQQILQGSTANYAILVPTKALINEVRSNFIGSLNFVLKDKNYRIVTASGDLALKQDHHFIFVMTPERLLYTLIAMPDIQLDFLFIDEAHKISERGGRSSYYYKVLSLLSKKETMPTVVFASPNTPNPEIYLNLIPGIKKSDIHKLASKYSPVCQFKYFIDFVTKEVSIRNDYLKKTMSVVKIKKDASFTNILRYIGQDKQNIVYCSAKQTVVDAAVEYAKSLSEETGNEKLMALATEIKNEVHSDCYLADLVKKGVAYHVGYLPGNIRLRIEKSFEEGLIRTIFCTSTLIEGVNLPADNLFITSYKNGLANMNELEFRNLVGRVGRIKYNLYGNVFFVRQEEKQKPEKFIELLENEVPEQRLSIDISQNSKCLRQVIDDLLSDDKELNRTHELAQAEQDFEALRKFAMMLVSDIAEERTTPIVNAFSDVLTEEDIVEIKKLNPIEQTNDDISLSYDQVTNLRDLIASGEHYPELKGENDDVDFNEVVNFLMKLRTVFKWDIYEKDTIGRPGKYSVDAVLRWYSVILLRWIRGNGLNQIIYFAIKNKEENPNSGVWVGRNKMANRYEGTKLHKNYIIAETLGIIENTILFSISNYFRKFSLEYKEFHKVDHFENDWYEYVEYGTTNPKTIFLQQTGFSREASTFIMQPSNARKYVEFTEDGVLLKKSILECGNASVETEAFDIQFNMPEIFID